MTIASDVLFCIVLYLPFKRRAENQTCNIYKLISGLLEVLYDSDLKGIVLTIDRVIANDSIVPHASALGYGYTGMRL